MFCRVRAGEGQNRGNEGRTGAGVERADIIRKVGAYTRKAERNRVRATPLLGIRFRFFPHRFPFFSTFS